MGISDINNAKRNLPPGIELLPGETIEKLEKSSSIKLFETTVNGGITECGGDIGGGECHNLMDVNNQSTTVITNYRIIYQPLKPLKHFSRSLSSSSLSLLTDTIHPRAIQIPHLSISQINESQNQITITLKFSPLKYLFKFSKPKPSRSTGNSLCNDFSFLLKKFTNPNSIESVFAFRMGVNEINNNNSGKEKDGNEGKKRELNNLEKFYEDLFDANTNTSEEENDDEVIMRGLDENKHKRIQKLGWSKGGYKIQKEFERMQMSKDSWNIVSYNDDFALSPTYPKEFILPSRILKKDATFACESFDTSADDSYAVSTAFQSSSEFFEKLVNFRKNGRFPLICWKKGHHILLRSGQPMVSILGWRGVEDELLTKDMLQQIINNSKFKKNSVKSNNNKRDSHHKKIGGLQEKCTNTKICLLDARAILTFMHNNRSSRNFINLPDL